jgi:hypothetical protein
MEHYITLTINVMNTDLWDKTLCGWIDIHGSTLYHIAQGRNFTNISGVTGNKTQSLILWQYTLLPEISQHVNTTLSTLI